MAQEYLIHELARLAGVSIRTVRYYLNEGLLPPPSIRGKYAVFSAGYLDRLELIRRLKDAFLPLREIQQRVGHLTDKEVRALLDELKASQPEPKGFEPGISADMTIDWERPPNLVLRPRPEDALDYIARVLETQNRAAPEPPQAPANTIQPMPAQVPVGREPEPEGEAWQRIELAPGIEIHLRQPPDPQHKSKIYKLLQTARKLFHRS